MLSGIWSLRTTKMRCIANTFFLNNMLANFFCACIIDKEVRGGNSVVECFLAKEDVASSSLVSRLL